MTMDGQSTTNGQQALKIVQWNAEGVWLKKTEQQHFLKLKAIDVCCIQETHLSSSHRFFIRGYKVFRQDRENRPKGGLLTLVRNNIPAAEIQRSGQADLDTEYLGVKLVLAGTPVTVSNIYSLPDKQIQLHNIKVELVLDYHRRLQQPLIKLGLWAAQQQRRRSGKLDHRKSGHPD